MENNTIKKTKSNFYKKTHIAINISTILCFISFVTNLIQSLKDGIIDNHELHVLLSSVNCVETIILFVVGFALRDSKK